MEKIILDEEKIKEFVENSNELNGCQLFYCEIDGEDYGVELYFGIEYDEKNQPYKCYWLYMYCHNYMFTADGSETFGDFCHKCEVTEKMDWKKVYQMAQSQTDKFTDTINKEYALIEDAKQNNVQRYIDRNYRSKDFVNLVQDIEKNWKDSGLKIDYESLDMDKYEDEGWFDNFGRFQDWLEKILENKTANQDN